MKQNCWEFKNCGREAGGAKSVDLGVCPAATDTAHQGVNGGQKAGRHCWKVAGTLCGGEVQGSWAAKMGNCKACTFFHRVQRDEDSAFAA